LAEEAIDRVARSFRPVPIDRKTEETQVCHFREEFHRKRPLVEMIRDDGHTFFVHKLPNFVSEELLLFCQ
jgi:hypothetical protein